MSNPSLKSTTAGPKEGLTTFSYPQFPALTPALYGPIRPARLLLQKPEKGRQLSQSSKELQETIEARTRTLGRTNSSRSMSDSASKKQALKERMARSKIRNLKVLLSIIMIQSLYRMLRPRRAYKKHLLVSLMWCGALLQCCVFFSNLISSLPISCLYFSSLLIFSHLISFLFICILSSTASDRQFKEYKERIEHM